MKLRVIYTTILVKCGVVWLDGCHYDSKIVGEWCTLIASAKVVRSRSEAIENCYEENAKVVVNSDHCFLIITFGWNYVLFESYLNP